MITINITLKLEPKYLIRFEDWLRQYYNVISLIVIPNTEKLYETDKTFKKLVANVKKVKRIRDIYVNLHNKC